MASPFLFRWQRAVTGESGPPATTRHVLLTLSVYMDLDGGNCYPTTRQLAGASGLSERAVCTHLELAERAGWIRREERRQGRGWNHHRYLPFIPDALKDVQHVEEEGTEGRSVRKGRRRTERGARRTERDDGDALKDVQSTYTETNPTTNPTTLAGATASPRVRREKGASQGKPATALSTRGVDLWLKRFPESVPPGSRIGQALNGLAKKHPEEEILARFDRYLTQAEARYVPSAEKFAQTFSDWGEDAPAVRNGNVYHDESAAGPELKNGSPLAHWRPPPPNGKHAVGALNS